MAATRFRGHAPHAEDLKRIRRALIGMEYEIANDRLGDEEDFAFHAGHCGGHPQPHFQALSEHLGSRRAARDPAGEEQYQEPSRGHGRGRAGRARGPSTTRSRRAIRSGRRRRLETHLRNAAKRLNMYLKGLIPRRSAHVLRRAALPGPSGLYVLKSLLKPGQPRLEMLDQTLAIAEQHADSTPRGHIVAG
ncbi:hypothetical protein ACU4GD_30440 [Cupriavidus basilensis]